MHYYVQENWCVYDKGNNMLLMTIFLLSPAYVNEEHDKEQVQIDRILGSNRIFRGAYTCI